MVSVILPFKLHQFSHASTGLGWVGNDDESCGIDNKCSSHGSCSNNLCSCEMGWSGFDCEVSESCPKSCSGQGTCSAGTCSCNATYYGIGCEFSFCTRDQVINAASGDVLDRTSNGPFPVISVREGCSWIINVPSGVASVGLQLLDDAQLRYMAVVLDGAITFEQYRKMSFEQFRKRILLSTGTVYAMAKYTPSSIFPINCSDSRWTGSTCPPL
jgi:hypothetical protein